MTLAKQPVGDFLQQGQGINACRLLGFEETFTFKCYYRARSTLVLSIGCSLLFVVITALRLLRFRRAKAGAHNAVH